MYSRRRIRADTAAGARRNRPSTTLKTAVVPPTPSASVATAAAVKAGRLRSMRTAKRTSCHTLSTTDSQPTSRTRSFTASTLPISTRAARTAASRLMPLDIFFSVTLSRYSRSSSSSSCSARFFRNRPRNPPMTRLRMVITALPARLSDSRNCRGLDLPIARLVLEFGASASGEAVDLRAAVFSVTRQSP